MAEYPVRASRLEVAVLRVEALPGIPFLQLPGGLS